MDTSQIVLTVSTAALALITWWYARSTANILEGTRRTAKAVERQASAAEESLTALRKQAEEQSQVGRMIVANAIQSAANEIEYWKNADIITLAVRRALPTTIDLVPAQAGAALEYAARISPEAAAELRSAFDCLRRVRGELESIREVQNNSGNFYNEHHQAVKHWLDMATAEIESAQSHLRGEEAATA